MSQMLLRDWSKAIQKFFLYKHNFLIFLTLPVGNLVYYLLMWSHIDLFTNYFLKYFGDFLKIYSGFTPCKAEQPIQGTELQENNVQKD